MEIRSRESGCRIHYHPELLGRVWGGQAGRCGYGRLPRVRKSNCIEMGHRTWKMVKGCGSEREPGEGVAVR